MQNTSQNKDEDIVDDDSDASLDDPAGIIFKIKLTILMFKENFHTPKETKSTVKPCYLTIVILKPCLEDLCL